MKDFWLFSLIKLNWANLITNRKAFVAMIAALCLQGLLYFSLWVIIFSRISSLKGWGLREVAFLYGGSAIGYGLIFSLFGGLNRLGDAIQNGALDMHLSRPRSPLLLAAMERMRADSLGDMITGMIILGIFVRPSLSDLPLIAILSLTAGLVFVSFRLAMHSLAFWSVSNDAAENGFMAFFITGTNPQKGFNPYLKLALLTIFPAGYSALLPVEIIRDFRWDYFGLQIGGSLAIFCFALWLFNQGLKRYTSGNKFIVLR